jgi:oligopeptide transport system ATP-binding protein
VLELRDVVKHFSTGGSLNPLRRSVIPAVDGVSLTLPAGRTTAIVGESGSGKSTLARLVVHLLRPDAGGIWLLGEPVHHLSGRAFRPLRRHVQMVFQNPLLSFDPMYSLGRSIRETLRLRAGGVDDPEASVAQLLEVVGLSPSFSRRHPVGMSGGELQRAALARALAPYPELVVLDEPTSALDMSIQGQVLALLRRLQRERGLSYLMATHDLRVVRLLAHEVVVLYLGQVVEVAPTARLFSEPLHPYTLGLLFAEGAARPPTQRAIRISGWLRYPEPGYAGCRLVGRCPLAAEACRKPQQLLEVEPGHAVRCWRAHAGETVRHAS